MKKLSKDEIQHEGRMILIYSETGVGKTATAMLTCPDPIAYVQTEPRSFAPTRDVILKYRPDLEFDVFEYMDAEDLIAFLANTENLNNYSSVVFDGLSFLMNVALAEEVTDEAYEARSEKDKEKKPLMQMTKMTMEGQGVRNQLMFRITKLLMKYAQMGKIVVCTALLHENPKWNRALSAAPALSAKEFPNNMPGFFDLIGKVEPRIDDGKIVYPPMVDFEAPDNSFVAKFTGIGDKRSGPLDIMKILAANKIT